MVRFYVHFWHSHESDEYPNYDLSRFRRRARVRTFPGFPKTCDDCKELIFELKGSDCPLCKKKWHLDCIPSSPDDIDHPFHPYHRLKLFTDGPPDNSSGKCDTCQKKLNSLFYCCSICDFNMHVRCSKNPPPRIVETPKCHKHTLTLMARNDTFTCNACGMPGERCPYVCLPCALMFHQDCTMLPHVININRHDHRVSHTYSLAYGDWKCLICHKKVDWRYGAYSCSTCPDYVVHSKCATRTDVWDGEELEGVPEEIIDVSPFKVIEEGVINHFSHDEHNLRIVEDVTERDGSVRCEACVHPIFSEKHYSCMECNFIIHETCANLPLRKRHWVCTSLMTLISSNKEDNNENFFNCSVCQAISSGLRYEFGKISLDVRCASMSWYFDKDCHPHTLFYTTPDGGTCGGCHNFRGPVLNCVEIECKFSLCFKCANLPKKIRHRCDDHFLLLRFGEEAKGEYWCEVCETLLDPQNWFYTCEDNCGVVCHIECVLGEFWNAMPGYISMDVQFAHSDDEDDDFFDGDRKLQVVPNDSMSRPKCRYCDSHCQRPLVLKSIHSGIEYFCCKTTCPEKSFVYRGKYD